MEELKTLPEYLKATNADGTAVLEATASWCPQCKAIAPFVEQMRKKYPEARFYTYEYVDMKSASFDRRQQCICLLMVLVSVD